jgi:hypothetical protein
MWYEMDMVEETLQSLSRAINVSNIPVDISVCFNKQTYLEKPLIDNINERFDKLAIHPVLKNASIVEKTDADTLYNIGDWRREVKTSDGYTIWGESDTLLPIIYFPLLEQMWNVRDQLSNPHVVTISSRKMWDSSWESVEHPAIRQYIAYPTGKTDAPQPLSHDQYINQEQLDAFNEKFSGELDIELVNPPKLDGSMVALHPELPQLIANEIHLPSEDFCAQLALTVLNIPQYHISNVIKGHNYYHPNKRNNTAVIKNEYGEVLRTSELYERLKRQSVDSRNTFIQGLLHG